MRKIVFSLLAVFVISSLSAQDLEDSLAFYADVLLHAEIPTHREYAHQLFESHLHKKLTSDPGFTDELNLMGIPVLYNPDSSFRLISWQVLLKDQAKTNGLLQFNGSQEIIKFEDKLTMSGAREYGAYPSDRWIGAVYTDIFKVPGHDSLYLLKGYNNLDAYTTIHVLEILDISKDKVMFGAPLFENDNKEVVHRRLFEIAKGATFNLVLSDSLNRIVSDHLTAVPYNRDESRMVNVPDGSYEVLEWNGDRWLYQERLYENRFQELPMDSVPKRKENRDIFGRPRNR